MNGTAAFIGAFTALLMLEVFHGTRWRYVAAFVVGLLVSVMLTALVGWLAHFFPHGA